MLPEFMGSERTRRESVSLTPFTEVQTQIARSNSSGKRNSMASEFSATLPTDTEYLLISTSWAKLPDASLGDYRPKSRRRRSSVCKVVKIIKSLKCVCSCIGRCWKIRIERQKWPQIHRRNEDTGGAPRGVGGCGLMERDQISFSGLDMVAITPTETGALNQFIDTMEPPPPYDATASAYALPPCPTPPPRPLSTISSSHQSSHQETVSVIATTTERGRDQNQNMISVQRQSQEAFPWGMLFRSPVTVRLPFTPRNQNELEVTIGEKLRILGIFHDGWCSCLTEGGRKGVVPMTCLHIPVGNEPEIFVGLPQVAPLYTTTVSRPFTPSRGGEVSVTVGEKLGGVGRSRGWLGEV